MRPVLRIFTSSLLLVLGTVLCLEEWIKSNTWDKHAADQPSRLPNALVVHWVERVLATVQHNPEIWMPLVLVCVLSSTGLDLMLHTPGDDLVPQIILGLGASALLLRSVVTTDPVESSTTSIRSGLRTSADVVVDHIDGRLRGSPRVVEYLDTSSFRIGLTCLLVGSIHVVQAALFLF